MPSRDSTEPCRNTLQHILQHMLSCRDSTEPCHKTNAKSFAYCHISALAYCNTLLTRMSVLSLQSRETGAETYRNTPHTQCSQTIHSCSPLMYLLRVCLGEYSQECLPSTHTYIHVHTYTRTRERTCTHTHTHAHTRTHTYACTPSHTHAHTHENTHTHTHTHGRAWCWYRWQHRTHQ